MIVWQKAFEEHGVPFPLDWWLDTVGRGVSEVKETPEDYLERALGREIDRHGLFTVTRQARLEMIHANSILPGVTELIELAIQLDLRLAVVSSSKHQWVDTHLERLGLRNYFETTVCADDVPRAKPQPDLYLEALRRFDLKPHEAIALEDSPNGARAAVAAGVPVIAVPNFVTGQLDLSYANRTVSGLHEVDESMLREVAKVALSG